jgi:hypothetical protein
MMDLEYSKKLIDILIDNASRILNAHFGVDRAESTFIDIIDLLREDQSLEDQPLKAYFLAKVRKTLEGPDPYGLDEGSVPMELIQLAVHELRWPEFRALSQKRRILEAYDDHWMNREFYRRYRA